MIRDKHPGSATLPVSAQNLLTNGDLSGDVSNRKLGEDNFGPALGNPVQLVVEDVPLGVHHLLVLVHVVQTNLENKTQVKRSQPQKKLVGSGSVISDKDPQIRNRTKTLLLIRNNAFKDLIL